MANLRKYSPLVNRKETEAAPDGKLKKKHRSTESQQLAAGGNEGRKYSHRMWNFQLALAVVCAGKRRPSLVCNF